MTRKRIAAWLAEAGVVLLALSERLDPIETIVPRRSVIHPVGRCVAFDVEAYRFTKGGDA